MGGGGCTALALRLGLSADVARNLGAVDAASLRALLAAGGKAAVDAQLKAAGLTSMGHRLKLIAGLLAGGENETKDGAAAASSSTSAAAPVPAAALAPLSGPPEAEDGALAAARAKGTDVDALRRLVTAGDRDAVSAQLKAAGYKTGQRLKIESALYSSSVSSGASTPGSGRGAPAVAAPSSAAASQRKPFQVDLFGNKRGRGLRDLSCARYEAKPIVMNHCAGPGNADVLNCVRCGFPPAAHEDLGSWQQGEPMLVDESGQRFRSLPAS